jgi:rhodanese-related sulfurtransferase
MKEITPNEALAQLQENSGTVYLDVRSVPEFQQGHPIRAINIPLLHFLPGMGMMPNEDFEKVVQANIPTTTRLIVGCKTGGRSANACQILTRIGYADVANVRGGFVGVMDQTGRLLEPGWSLLSYPVCAECSKDAQYETLASKAK